MATRTAAPSRPIRLYHVEEVQHPVKVLPAGRYILMEDPERPDGKAAHCSVLTITFSEDREPSEATQETLRRLMEREEEPVG